MTDTVDDYKENFWLKVEKIREIKAIFKKISEKHEKYQEIKGTRFDFDDVHEVTLLLNN